VILVRFRDMGVMRALAAAAPRDRELHDEMHRRRRGHCHLDPELG
jgi:hypothetical protein